MKLTKPMLKAFESVMLGENTIAKIAKNMQKSIKWADNVINELEKEGFVVKKSNYTIKGSRLIIEIAPTLYAQKLREIFFEFSGIRLDNVLTEGRLLFLAAVSEDWMSIPSAMKLSGLSKHTIERYRPSFRNRGILKRDKNLYTINEKAWPLLKEFILAYKNYSNIDGRVRWRYNEEILFEVKEEKSLKGSVTGMYTYKEYKVSVGVISALCIIPKKDLSKEEVFVHSLFEVEDPRTLHLALAFYLKNKLNYGKVMSIAMKYGKYSMFNNFVKLIGAKEEKVRLEGLPVFDRRDFIRIAHMYEVYDVY